MGKAARAAREAEELEDKALQFWGNYFCGCGDPQAAMIAFREIMELFVEPGDGWVSVHLDLERWQDYEKKYGRGLTYCILYWLEGMGLTEHGGSVGGSWMTPLGERIRMEVLTENLPDHLKEG